AVIETSVNNGTAGGIIGENANAINAETFVGFDYQGSITSVFPNAILGGVIGKQSGDFTNVAIPMKMSMISEGTNAIVGGIVGQYDNGLMVDTNVLFSGSIASRGALSIAGGVVGKSNLDHRMNDVLVTGTG